MKPDSVGTVGSVWVFRHSFYMSRQKMQNLLMIDFALTETILYLRGGIGGVIQTDTRQQLLDEINFKLNAYAHSRNLHFCYGLYG